MCSRPRPALALLIAFPLIGPGSVGAHELITTGLTWTEQISRIFERKCVSCHREGGSAPMPLETYEQVRPWATAIKLEVLSRRMPPWFAVKGFGAFRDDLSLSQEDLAAISSWVEGGSPEGDAAYLGDASHAHEGEPAASQSDAPVAQSHSLELAAETKLEAGVQALAIRPERVPAGGWLQAVAHRPDGSVEHLLWVRDFDPAWQRLYVFRERLELPAGARILLHPQGVTATLIVAGDPGEARAER